MRKFVHLIISFVLATASAASSLLPAGPGAGVALAATQVIPTLDAPQRLVDTRTTGGPIGMGQSRCFQVAGVGGIPADAAGVVLNVTAVGYVAQGWLTLYPAGQAVPATSTLNFDPNEYAIANGAIIPLGTGGQVCVSVGTVNSAPGASHVVLDATGYLTATGLAQLPMLTSPQRLADTRSAGGSVGMGQSRCFQVAGLMGIPADAAAVVLNVTAVGYGTRGWLTAYPAGQAVPATSTLNFDTTEYAMANGTIMGIGTGGQVCVSVGTVNAAPGGSHIVLDATGYLTAAGLAQLPTLTSPQRLVDTRTTGGPIATGQSRCFQVAGQAGIPADAAGVVLNVTAVGYGTRGWLTAYPAGQAVPATSTLNFDTSEYAMANGTIMGIGTGGQVCVSVGTVNAVPGASHVVLDVVGYLPAAAALTGLRVKAVFNNSGAANAGAGVVIRVNGVEAGVTDASGMLTVSQAPGSYTVQGVLPSLAIGSVATTVTAGQLTDVTIPLNGDAEVVEPGDLQLQELVNGGLPLDTPSITLRFTRSGAPVTVTDLQQVELTADDPSVEPIDLTDSFGITQGVVKATDLATVIGDVQGLTSNARLRVIAMDSRGFTFDEQITFAAGVFQVNGQLVAPPSQPSLPVAGLTVRARYGNGLETTVTTDGAGRFQVNQVPGGMLDLFSTEDVGGTTYTGWVDIPVDGSKQVTIRMLGLADVVAGVPPWQVTSTKAAVTKAAAAATAQRRRQAATLLRPSVPSQPTHRLATPGAPPSRGPRTNSVPAAVTPAQVSVSAAGEGVPVTGSATFTATKGTKKVILKYEVSTAEYPYWVMKQSRYNDTWWVQVMSSSGGQLFSIQRAVNSQLYAAPTWNGAGSTGQLQQEIDVSALTTNNDVPLTLAAMAQNIGDDILPTAVTATLGADETLVIDTITNDTVVPTVGQSDRYSIPRPGQSNTFQRHFDLTFTKPDTTQLTNVKAELLDENGGSLQTVVDEAPGSPHVQLLNDTTVRVEVTFSNTASAVASTPPPADRISYRFTLKGRKNDGTELQSDPKQSATYYALWKMPDGLPRYGLRDQGGDDWAAQKTYNWLAANAARVTRIDDISGEHARDLGHHTHERGVDIDMFHVYTFPNGAASGTENYLRLRENVMAALGGNQQALAQVNAWATATRGRFDTFIADNDVQRIYYALGSATAAPPLPRLGNGWAQALLENGTYTNPDGVVINLAAGAWANAGHAKMRYNATHNNHFHVALTYP